MQILIVLTSHDKLGDTGKPTGFWLEEFAAPFYRLKEAGATLTLASPKGGQPPIDPASSADGAQTDATKRFNDDKEAQAQLASTKKLSDVKHDDFDAVFYPGGHGPLWDLATDSTSIALIESFANAKKPVGAVCHAPAVLVNVKAADGSPLVKGRKVTGFTNEEEGMVGLTDVVPFLLQDKLAELGGKYESGSAWGVHVAVDGLLITGQNPASSEAVADELVKLLKK